jgi:hypothetical protein
LSKEKEETKCWRSLPTQLTKEKEKEKGRLVALDLTTSSSEVAYFENAWCSMAADFTHKIYSCSFRVIF